MSTFPNLAESLDLPGSDSLEAVDWLRDLFAERVEPEPQLTVSQWADQHRILPETAAEPGRWRTSRTPYLQEIMDALSATHPCEFVYFMKGSQIGGTEIGLNWIGYTIHHSPGLMLVVQPTLQMVKRNTVTRIDPLIEATPELKSRVVAVRSREGGNSMFRKAFP
ncbi:MAG: phage terminase large subunit family protein, partial [Verrucomicrobiia bacterium]